MKRVLFLVILGLALAGCVRSVPQETADFEKVLEVKELAGIYRNAGQVGNGKGTVFLSSLIWSDESDLDHKGIETIEVSAVSDTTVLVRARARHGIVREGTFTKGKHFEISNGAVRLKRQVGFAGFAAGEPMLGPYYENSEVGIDVKGHGKYRSEFAFAGLLYMVFPIALGGYEEVRFEKLGL